MQYPELLENAIDEIEYGRYQEALSLLSRFTAEHPEAIDDAFRADVRALELLIKYRQELQEWDYFRSLKLVYRYFEKAYLPELESGGFVTGHDAPDLPDTIWWCWLQGLDAAPDVVRACYASLKKLNRPIQIITAENYAEFATLPAHIVEKWREGIISNAHFADALRLELLTTHGGIWIDATVYCTDATAFEAMIRDTPLFCYAYVMHDATRDYILYGNWLIRASAASRILQETKYLLYRYWEKENSLMNYFIFHLFFSIACRRNEAERSQIPTYSDAPCHIMQMELAHPYDPSRFAQLCAMTPIHKLTYRYHESATDEGTVLRHILGDAFTSSGACDTICS